MSKEERNLATPHPAGVPATRAPSITDNDYEAQDFAFSWLRIAGATSAVVVDPDQKIDGLVGGQFFETLGQTVFGQSIRVVVLKPFRSYSEKTPGDKGVFVRNIPKEEFDSMHLRRDGSKYPLPNGNVVGEQMNYMVWMPDYPECGIMRMPLSAGSFASALVWNARRDMIKNRRENPLDHYQQVWELNSTYNQPKVVGQAGFFAIGKGSTLTGKFIREVTPDELAGIVEKVKLLAAMGGKLTSGHGEPVETDPAADADSAAQYGTEKL